MVTGVQQAEGALETSLFKTTCRAADRRWLVAIVVIFLAVTGLRIVNLDADPVSWFIGEIGYQIDEGYKTLGPRNLSLYGDTNWHEADQYPGWMRASAMTQWPYYWAFEAWGAKLSSARMVSVLYSGGMVLVAAAFLWRRHSAKAAALGVLLLMTDPGLFLFARSALFETALAFFTYVPLFIALSVPGRLFSFLPLLLLGLSTAPAFYFVKKTVLIYMAPTALALAAHVARERFSYLINAKTVAVALAVGMACVAGFLYHESWILDDLNVGATLVSPHRMFLSPMHQLSPLALILGYGVLLEILLKRPGAIFEDAYRCCLASILVVGPIILSFLIYNYPRYYIPIIPAAFLLVVERFSMPRELASGAGSWLSVSRLPALLAFLMLSMALLASLNFYVLGSLPINIGDDPGMSDPALLKVFPVFALLFGLSIYFVLRPLWRVIGRELLIAVTVLSVVTGLGIAVVAVFKPTYQADVIRHGLVSRIGEQGTVGGDWAPFFVAGTPVRALYMRPDWNSAEMAATFRVEYFLSSGTPYDMENIELFEANPEASLGEPIPLGIFYNHDIVLYPVIYAADAEGDELPATEE